MYQFLPLLPRIQFSPRIFWKDLVKVEMMDKDLIGLHFFHDEDNKGIRIFYSIHLHIKYYFAPHSHQHY